MRTATHASACRGDPVVDRQQSDLFAEALAEELTEPAPQAAEQGQGEDAPARRGRRRRVSDGPEPPLQVPIDRLDGDPPHPREDYPQESLEDLARDIAERGVLQATRIQEWNQRVSGFGL